MKFLNQYWEFDFEPNSSRYCEKAFGKISNIVAGHNIFKELKLLMNVEYCYK